MQALGEMDLSFLLSEVSDDPESVEALIIDEIERSLPDIISHLRIPGSGGRYRAQLIEFRLAGKPGFRRLSAKQRQKATQDLENESFLRSLRKAQEVFSNGIRVGTSKRSGLFLSDLSVENGVFIDLVTQAVDTKETTIVEIASSREQAPTDGIHAPVDVHGLEGELPFGLVGDALSRTVSDKEDIPECTLEIPDIPIELQESLADRDVRDLLALIRDGKLVSFIDPSVENLIPKGIKIIRVPRTKIYGALSLDRLIATYHDLAASDEVSPDLDDELRLLDALIVAMEHEAQWSRINTRRFHLINKKHSLGLQGDEEEELDALDQLAERLMYAVQDLPFAELAMLKTYARRLGFEEDVG